MAASAGSSAWTAEYVGSAVASGIFAASVNVASIAAMERLGTGRGGILAGLPILFVPSSVGIALHSTPRELTDSMFAIPVGEFINIWFLYQWRLVPPHLHGSWRRRLCLMVAWSLGGWLVLALGSYYAQLAVAGPAPDARLYIAPAATLTALLLGAWLCWEPTPPARPPPLAWYLKLSRGGFTCVVTVVAIMVCAKSHYIGGILVSFPAGMLTMMVVLWVNHGDSHQTSGAVGPIILSTVSLNAYVMMFALLVEFGGLGVGPACGAAFVAVVLGVSLPMYAYVEWRSRATAKRDALLGRATGGTPRRRTPQMPPRGARPAQLSGPIPVPAVVAEEDEDTEDPGLSYMSFVQTPLM